MADYEESLTIEERFGANEGQLDAWAKEYEEGTWEGGVGEIRKGRPRLFDEDLATLSVRVPASRIAAMDSVAQRLGLSRSQFLRDAIDEKLLRTAS